MDDISIEQTTWTFCSNHTHVLVCLAADGSLTLREVASQVGITERAVQRIVSELGTAGVLNRERDPSDARRNRYSIQGGAPLRHPMESHCSVGDLLALITGAGTASRSSKRA